MNNTPYQVLALICLGAIVYFTFWPRPEVKLEHQPAADAAGEVWQLTRAMRNYVSTYATTPPTDPLALRKALEGENPRRLVFIKIDPKKLSKEGEFLDPWQTPYLYGVTVEGYAWTYSYGPNKIDEGGRGDDVASW